MSMLPTFQEILYLILNKIKFLSSVYSLHKNKIKTKLKMKIFSLKFRLTL